MYERAELVSQQHKFTFVIFSSCGPSYLLFFITELLNWLK